MLDMHISTEKENMEAQSQVLLHGQANMIEHFLCAWNHSAEIIHVFIRQGAEKAEELEKVAVRF